MLNSLTPQQISELLNIVDVYVSKFIAGNLSPNFLTTQDLQLLKQYNISVPTNVTNKVEEAFKFGLLAKQLKNPKTMTYEQFKKELSTGKSIPLNVQETEAINSLTNYAYSQLKGLGNRINMRLGNIMIEADQTQRARYENIINEKMRQGLVERMTQKQIKSAIGHATQDWSRDIDRIVDFISHEAFDQGNVASIERESLRIGIKDPWVYKMVLDGACSHCNRLYKEGGKPKLFRLSELKQNGTNIGRKTIEWKAVVGATHPYCRCYIVISESQMNPIWDEQAGEFVPQLNEASKERLAKFKKKGGLTKIYRT